MNEDLNLVEILKYVPMGTKLWSSICGDCYFKEIREGSCTPIVCKTRAISGDLHTICFTKEGKRNVGFANGECVLFPSKDNKDWSAFKVQKPHKQFEPFQKVLVGLMMNGRKFWKRDVYMYYSEPLKHHCTIFESMVPDELIIPYDPKKDGELVQL